MRTVMLGYILWARVSDSFRRVTHRFTHPRPLRDPVGHRRSA